MKQKILLILIFCVGILNAQVPYRHLMITEALYNDWDDTYVEITNMGDSTVNLKDFEYGALQGSHTPILDVFNDPFITQLPEESWMLPDFILAPGKSFVITGAYDFGPRQYAKRPPGPGAVERPNRSDIYDVADLLIHFPEPNGDATDSVTPGWEAIHLWGGGQCLYLKHHYTDTTSAVVDQVGGVFQEAGLNVGPYDVAGVTNATEAGPLMRKFKIKSGNLDFANARGLGADDSEWIPIPMIGRGYNDNWNWRDTWWTVGNHGDYVLDANTLQSTVIDVDFAAKKLTVPWGIRRMDDIMRHMTRKPGIAWHYDLNGNRSDSLFRSAKTGDKLIITVCGNEVMTGTFDIVVSEPTTSVNIVVPILHGEYYPAGQSGPITSSAQAGQLSWPRVSTNANGIDTISGYNHGLDFALRTDSLLKYLEKPANATWEFVWVDGIQRSDLKNGDKLKVTAQNGNVKEYVLELQPFAPSHDAFLSSITWPDIPVFYKGIYGWKGDTIPGFSKGNINYIIEVPFDVEGIPALVAKTASLRSKITVKRATSLAGNKAARTVSFTVTAEDDSTTITYEVELVKEKDPATIQPYLAEPFLAEFIYHENWSYNYVDIMNPGNQPIDLSNYMITMEVGSDIPTQIQARMDPTDWPNRFAKYVPGYKWINETEWPVSPGILVKDSNVDPLLRGGDVFTIGARQGGFVTQDWVTGWTWPVLGALDVNFRQTTNILNNPWNEPVTGATAVSNGPSSSWMMFKITNDSVKNGTKPANDPKDFELIEAWGMLDNSVWVINGRRVSDIQAYIRKPNIYKPNPVVQASFGTNDENSEWLFQNEAYWRAVGGPFPDAQPRVNIANDIGRHTMIEPTHYKSTVASLVYKVSPGYLMTETIQGLTTGTTVTTFFENLIKANELQTLKVSSNGVDLLESAAISNGDILTVLSADSVNTSAYTLGVTVQGLSANATLTSVLYTINVTDSIGTISGFNMGTPLKTVFEGVTVPAGATLTITDQNDAYMSLTKLNFDTAYVNVTATDAVYFEVIAENGTNKILYQLKPTTSASDAYVTSDVYSVDQFASVIQFLPWGSSVFTLLSNVTPAPDATVKIYDKAALERTVGTLYRDDKLVVTSADGLTSKAYYLSLLSDSVVTYLAFVISEDYQVDQLGYTIKVISLGSTSVSDFVSKLYPSFGATVQVLDKDGNVNTAADLALDDQLRVTAADGKTTATYKIQLSTNILEPAAQLIKMYPNPTYDGRVVVQGLTKGDRVRVFNAAGITLRNVIADNSTDYVSLASQPAGIYVFVISSGDKNINIQKIIKK